MLWFFVPNGKILIYISVQTLFFLISDCKCLTLNGPAHFRIHPKIWCLNFKPQWSPKLFKSDKRFIARSKEDNQCFQFIFELLGWGPLRRTGSALCAKTLHASCLWLPFSMFQHMLESLWPNLDTSRIKGTETKTGKTENLRSFFSDFLHGPIIMILETSCQYSVKLRAMLCKIVWKSHSRVFFTIRSAGAFRSLENVTGTKSYHGPFRVKLIPKKRSQIWYVLVNPWSFIQLQCDSYLATFYKKWSVFVNKMSNKNNDDSNKRLKSSFTKRNKKQEVK